MEGATTYSTIDVLDGDDIDEDDGAFNSGNSDLESFACTFASVIVIIFKNTTLETICSPCFNCNNRLIVEDMGEVMRNE